MPSPRLASNQAIHHSSPKSAVVAEIYGWLNIAGSFHCHRPSWPGSLGDLRSGATFFFTRVYRFVVDLLFCRKYTSTVDTPLESSLNKELEILFFLNT